MFSAYSNAIPFRATNSPGAEMIRLLTVAEFVQAERDNALVGIYDSANKNKLHRLPCSAVKRAHIAEKVEFNNEANGRYERYESFQEALDSIGDRSCVNCLNGQSVKIYATRERRDRARKELGIDE
jgi:hypothetical protein